MVSCYGDNDERIELIVAHIISYIHHRKNMHAVMFHIYPRSGY